MDDTNDDAVDLSNPVARAVVSTEQPETQPQFAPTADADETVGRVREFVRQHAIAGRSFDTLTANYQKVYPDFDPPSKDEYQSWVDQAPQQVQLDKARQQVYQDVQAGRGPSGLGSGEGAYLGRRLISFPRDLLTSAVYTNAKSKMRENSADNADYRDIALYEHEQGLDAAQTQGMKVAGLFAGLPSQMAGMELGGAMARPLGAAVGEGLGLGARATGALQLAGQAILAPNLAAQAAIHQNLEAGREPWDIRGVASGTALSIAQLAVMHQVGKLTQGTFPGSGPFTSAAGRFVSQGAVGPFTQQLADATGYILGLQTRAGALQDFLEGKNGEGGQKIVQDALTYGGFGVLQGNPEAARKVGEAVRDSVNADMRRGKSGAGAAANIPDIGGVIDRLRQANPNPTRSDVQAAFEQAGIADHPVAQAVVQTFPETIRTGVAPQEGPAPAGQPEVGTPAPAQTARQRADALEQQHLDLTSQLQDARQTEARLKSEAGMGVGRPDELTEATALRVGLQRSLRRLEKDLDSARSEAALDEAGRRSQGANAAASGAERRQSSRPPQGVWDAIRGEHPDWTVEQIGREAARRADTLMVDPQTGLKSRAQYVADAAAHGSHTTIYDVPSMHEVNNAFGDQAGDALLAAHGAAIREAGIDRGYRKGGDELAALFDSPAEQQAKSARYQDILNNTVVAWEDANGQKVSVKGFGAAVAHGETPQQAQARLPAAKEAAGVAGFRSRGPGQLPAGLTVETSTGRSPPGASAQPAGAPDVPPAQRQDVSGAGRTTEPLSRLHKQLLTALGDATEEGGNLVGRVRGWQRRNGQPVSSAAEVKAAREELRGRGLLKSEELTPEQHEQLGRRLPGLRLEVAQLDKAMLAGELLPTKANKGLLRLLRGNLEAAIEAHKAGPGEYWFRADEASEHVPSPQEVEAAKTLIRQEKEAARGPGEPTRRPRPVQPAASSTGQSAAEVTGTGSPAVGPESGTPSRGQSRRPAAVPLAEQRPFAGNRQAARAAVGASNHLVGHETQIATPDGRSVPARYEVRELGDVRASHQVLPNGALRDRVQAGEYPANLQPRDYSASGEQQKVGRIASGMVPSMLVTNHPAASEGPPTITPDGTVLNGNGRQMGLERSAAIGSFGRYKAELLRQAKSFGLDPTKIEAMQRPVLYRTVNMDPESEEARQFAAAGNVSMTQSQSPVRTAASLSRLVTPELIDSLKLEGDTTFSEAVTDPRNGKAFRDRLRSELPPQEVGRFFHEDGRLTDAGTELVRSMLLAKVLPTQLIERMGEEMKGVKRTLEGAIPQLVQVMRDFPSAHVGPQLVEALNAMARNPKMRTISEADTVLSQGSLFGGRAEEVSPGARMMLDFLLEDGQKPLVFRRKLGALVEDLSGANGLYGSEYPDVVTMAAQALGVAPREGAAFGDVEGAVDEVNDAKRDAHRAGFAPQALEEVSRRKQKIGLAQGSPQPQGGAGPAGGPETTGAETGPQYFLGGSRGAAGGRGPGGSAAQPSAGAAGGSARRQPVGSGVDLLPAATGGLRELGAERQRRYDIVKAKIGEASRQFDDMVRAAGPDKQKRRQQFLDWTNPSESGRIAQMPAGPLKDAAQAVRDLYEERQPELERLGLVKNFIDNYLGHLWKDPQNPNATPEELAGRIKARRPFAGAESFRKERTLPTFEDGFNAGLEPLTFNPVEMQMLRLREVDKSITAHANFEEMKAKRAFKYFGLGERLPQGWAFFSDKMGKVFAPPQTPVKEFFDKEQMEGLEKFARSIGTNVRTLMKGTDIARAGAAAGMGKPPLGTAGILGASIPGEVLRRFGTPEEILAHEIGHQLDSKYGLRSWTQNPALRPELVALADLRASGQVSPEMQAYLRSPNEQIANLVAGYLHAPELTKRVAPNAYQAFDSFLQSHSETAPLRDIKPSLEIGEREQMMRLAGPMLVGNYAGPREVMNLYDRFLSPGLGGSGLYRGIRGAANTVNQFNLGLSAWHATGVALNSTFSSIALGLKKMSRGDFADGAGDVLSSPIAAFRDFLGGRSGKAEWLQPGTQGAAMAEDIRRVVEAGGRLGMDAFDRTSHLDAMRNALKDLAAGNVGTAIKESWAGTRLVPALAELLNKPTMDVWVPQVKLGAAMRALRYEADSALMRGVPMDVDARRQAFGRIWDSMDDRFGQLVYDNLFWNRTVKDAATAAVRAVGWNVGTIRAYGGAVKDITSSTRGLLQGQGISDRLAFGVASVFGSALVGAMTQYLLTGKGPSSLTDLAYPRTGKMNRDGTDERLSFPTYLSHDVAPLFNRSGEGPFRWIQNALGVIPGKLNPLLTVPWEAFAKNEDWRGAAIRNPDDPILQQTKDVFGHLVRSLLPFSVENAMNARHRGQPAGQIAGSFFGVTPAGYRAEHTAEQQRQAESGRKVQLTALQKKLRGQ